MYILGIETSCDDTALALLQCQEGKAPELVSEELSSQAQIHEPYGGIVPELAAREHLRNLPILFDRVLSDAGISLSQCSAIGVTRGPGLKGCLLMGVAFAKALSISANIPLIGINHIEGHIFAAMLDNPELKMPFLALVVSGGHTEILEIRALGDYHLVARTIDDAAGEAFDKSANLLGYLYPGGPELAALADSTNKTSFKLPKVMREAEGFSFSGLKTAIALLIKKHSEDLISNERIKAELAFAIQESIVDALCFKLKKAIKKTGLQRIAVTGGVSANKYLRQEIQKLKGCEVYFPALTHCMDNAAMIAYVAHQRYLAGERSDLSFDVYSRWSVETIGQEGNKNA